jgi:ABC-type transport system substrate-binding protein
MKVPDGVKNTIAEQNLQAFLDGTVDYLGELPIEARTTMADQIKVVETGTMSQMALLFNTSDEVVGDSKVRKAMSLVVDRTALAELLVFAKPATNIVGNGVYETTYKNKTLFKDVSGELFAPTANKAEAEKLINEAGAKGKTIKVTYRPVAADTAAFEYMKAQWESIGLKVEGKNDLTFKHEVDKNEYDLYWNKFYHAYAAGDFQVMIYDMLMSSIDPFSILAPFALEFSGNKVELTSLGNLETGDETADEGEIIQKPHVSGFNNETYNKLIADAWAIKKDNAERAALLHEAEKLLAEECPVVPLIEYQRYYVASEDISGVKLGSFGAPDFRKLKLKTYDPETLPAE